MAIEQIDQFMAAIRRLESGSYDGKYTAQGAYIPTGAYAGQQAYGAYQIMPGNWPSWSREAGLAGADIRDPAAQDAVARFKFEQYYRTWGSWDLVAIAWFAGGSTADKAKRNGIRSVGGLSDAIGTSVATYVQKIGRYMDEYEPPEGITAAGLAGIGFGSVAGEYGTVANARLADFQQQQEQQPQTPPTYQVTDPNQELGGFLQPQGIGQQLGLAPPTMRSTMGRVLANISDGVRRGTGIDLSAGPTDKIELQPNEEIG